MNIRGGRIDLSTFSTDSSSELDVLWRDGDTFGVDSAQVGVFKKADEVSFAGLLEGHDGGALETQVGLEVLGDLTDETLEGQLADQKLSGLLVTTDLTESYGTWSVTMGLLDSASGWGTLTSSLGGQLLSRCLASGRFASGLFGSRHFAEREMSRTLLYRRFYRRTVPCIAPIG